MTPRGMLLATLGCCALSACTPPAKAPAEAAPAEDAAAGPDDAAADPAAPAVEDSCNAAQYQSLVGANVAAVTLPVELNHRILGPNDAATMDHRPDRLNIMTDENGVVTEVKCG